MKLLKHVSYQFENNTQNNGMPGKSRYILACLLSFFCFGTFAEKIRISIPSEAIKVISEMDQSTEFSGENFQYLGNSGQPKLPYHMMKVLLPPDVDLSSINLTIENQQIQQLSGEWNVQPIPPQSMCNDTDNNIIWPPGKIIIDGKDSGIYKVDEPFPSTLINRALPGQMRQWQLIDVAIAAFQYNPVQKTLFKVIKGEVVVNFDFKLTTRLFSTPHIPGGKLVQDSLKRLSINFDEVSPLYLGTQIIRSFAAPMSTFAIITTNEIVIQSTTLQNFIQSKQQRGFNVQLITEDQWGGGVGDQAAENIRSWLKANYQNLNIEYVLLIGNPHPEFGAVPMKNVWARSHRAGLDENNLNVIYPSDFYYADLTGNWDLNGNGRYGESGDPYQGFIGGDFGVNGIDQNWEVLIGRIPYYGIISDLDHILAKIRSYENSAKNRIDWRQNVLFAMKPMNEEDRGTPVYTPGYHLGEAIKNDFLLPKGWSYHRVYQENYGLIPPPESTPTEISKVLYAWRNEPFGAAFWMTHGNSREASSIMNSTEARNLNDDYPTFTFQAACTNAFPEDIENLAYAVLRNGGIATIGATRMSFYQQGETNFVGANSIGGVSYEYARRLISMELDTGRALHELKQTYPDGYVHNVTFNIYGDPSIGLLTSSELETENANINDINVPVRENGKSRLIDGDLTNFWNTDGNPDNAWFELMLDSNYDLTQLNIAPRDHRTYTFKVFVDDVFIDEFTTESASNIEFQHFSLPAGTIGSKVKIEAINQSWFKIYEVELLGQQTTAPGVVTITDTEVPVRASNKSNLHDNNLTTSWNNDGNMANAWFDVILDGPKEITELRLAPRTQRAYTFNVYVDHIFVGQYTTASASTIALQTFDLPAGTAGSIIRIESVSHIWFKVHEVELYNGTPATSTCGNELAINQVTVPAREFRKRYLIDDDFSSTSFWSNTGDTWFELSLNGEQEINCLQLAPRENRAYTFEVYVDDNFVAQYTTEKAHTIALQNFTLPEGIIGSVVRVESVSHDWFKVHEIKLLGE